LAFLTLSDVFSTGSTDLSTEVEAWDLLSQVVDSEEAFGIEETSSSLVTVDEVEDARSGEDSLEASTGCEILATLGAVCSGCASWAFAGCSGRDSDSTSSAQLLGEALVSWPDALLPSLAGVAEPDADLLVVAGVETPFAACAYENVEAILVFV
jgi:hypothetical protein